MFSKLMKWLSSDRSEEPRPLSAKPEPEMPSAAVTMLCGRVKDEFNATLDERTMREVVGMLRRRQKIEAIKLIREETRLGLKESKDIADDLETVLKSTA